MTTPTATCPNCGEQFTKLKDGKIPTHDFPKPCRSVCRGSGSTPKRREETPLWKDDPEQESRDFFDETRQELLLYGFAVVKGMGERQKTKTGVLTCPLCLRRVRYSIAESNGHCAAKCETEGCINMIE